MPPNRPSRGDRALALDYPRLPGFPVGGLEEASAPVRLAVLRITDARPRLRRRVLCGPSAATRPSQAPRELARTVGFRGVRARPRRRMTEPSASARGRAADRPQRARPTRPPMRLSRVLARPMPQHDFAWRGASRGHHLHGAHSGRSYNCVLEPEPQIPRALVAPLEVGRRLDRVGLARTHRARRREVLRVG